MPFILFLKLIYRKADTSSSLQRVVSVFGVIGLIVLISWTVNTGKASAFYSVISPHNQAFTELAFNNVNNLPSTIPANNQISFSFWAHNVEGRAYTYPYTITLESGNTRTIVKKGTFTLPNNGQKTIDENITVPSSSTRQQVDVNLINLHQTIDFWLKGRN